MDEYIKSLEILGLKLPANLQNIKFAYHKLTKAKHPDKFQNSKLKNKATKEFKEINCAYNYLVKNYNNFHIDNNFENIEEDILMIMKMNNKNIFQILNWHLNQIFKIVQFHL